MPPTRFTRAFLLPALCATLVAPPSLFAWGREGHLMINKLAIEKLPADVPAFLKTPAAEAEITWLGPEPDRWKSPLEPELGSASSPEHYIDFEYADVILPSTGGKLPRRRFDYLAALYAATLTHPEMARDLRPERVGLLPYEGVEIFERLQAAFRSYRDLKAKNLDAAPAEHAAIFYAGWLGHYVADGSQPLHVTQNFNGWTMKDNPHNYANDHTIHSRFESGFVSRNIKAADVDPLITPVHPLGDPFEDFVAYLRTTQSNVERVYQFDQQHAFDGAGTDESRKFTEDRLAAGASMLRDLIDTAWINSAKPLPARDDD
jgi:hypothetical protein